MAQAMLSNHPERIRVGHISLSILYEHEREKKELLQHGVNACMYENGFPNDFTLGNAPPKEYPPVFRYDEQRSILIGYFPNNYEMGVAREGSSGTEVVMTAVRRGNSKDAQIITHLRACYTRAYENPSQG